MITIFNRAELITTFSMQKQSEVRSILSDNGIKYTVRTVNRNSPSSTSRGHRGRTGTFGENLAFAYEYIIYVKKEDLALAAHLIR